MSEFGLENFLSKMSKHSVKIAHSQNGQALLNELEFEKTAVTEEEVFELATTRMRLLRREVNNFMII